MVQAGGREQAIDAISWSCPCKQAFRFFLDEYVKVRGVIGGKGGGS